MPDTLATRQADRIARSFTHEACRGRMVYLQEAADYAARFLRSMQAAGLPEHREGAADDLATLRGLVLDVLNSTHGLITKEADSDGIPVEWFPLDLSEIA